MRCHKSEENKILKKKKKKKMKYNYEKNDSKTKIFR